MLGRSILSLGLGSLASTAASVSAADVCNGHAELCSKKYSNMTFLGAHNSYAVGSSIADNQNKEVTDQLNDGIRTLQVQTHNASDGIHSCHSSCSSSDGGLLSDYSTKINTWVKANPTEVITIVIVNIDTLPPTTFASAFESSGLSSSAYSPSASASSISEWPTLGELVDSGKNVIVFMDYNADFTTVPYIMDEFTNIWEDAYDVTTTGWECAVNRSSGSSGSMMMLVNHFLDTTYAFGGTQFFVPNKNELNVTNSEASISSHVGNCNSIWGRAPNHILLDFYDSNGNEPFNYVAQSNGVAAPTNTVTEFIASATGSSASSSGTARNAQISQSALGAASSRVDLASVKWGSGLGSGSTGMIAGGMAVRL